MNRSAEKWQSIRKNQPVEIGIVQVEIGGAGQRHDHVTDLILTHAKDACKDALLKIADRHGGKLVAWEGDGGTFLFLIYGQDGCNKCCLASLQMLDQLPGIKRDVQLSDDLRSHIMIRIACDVCTMIHDPEIYNLPRKFVDAFKEHGQSISVGNQVTLTERLFRHLDKLLQSRFGKWKHSTELGVDLYSTTAPSVRVVVEPEDWPAEEEDPEQETEPRAGDVPIAVRKMVRARRKLGGMCDTLKSRKMLSVGAGAAASLALPIVGLVWIWPVKPPPVPPAQLSSARELVQTEEWRNWRRQIHEKLSVDKITERTLAEALKIKLPTGNEQAAAALRRDQAIADVLLSYPDVQAIFTSSLDGEVFELVDDHAVGCGQGQVVEFHDQSVIVADQFFLGRTIDFESNRLP
jgi:hypothetical protein